MNSTALESALGPACGTHSGDALPASNLRELTMTPAAADDLIHSAHAVWLGRAGTPKRYAAAPCGLTAAAAVIAVVASRSSRVRANRPVRQQVRSAWVVLREVCPPCRSGQISLPWRPDPCRCWLGPCVGARAADDLVRMRRRSWLESVTYWSWPISQRRSRLRAVG